MVFSSVPLYLDPPNWQQQHTNDNQHHHHQQIQNSSAVGSGNEIQHHHLIIPSQQPVAAQQFGPHVQPHQVGLGVPPVRPNSMAERARALKIPPPENPLKCPRCESTNTKFCYYNNYSLTQPRHFCKTCRRYWTRGGALRNVPVGGGCRRNKRSSSKSSGGGATSSSSTKSSLSSPTVTAVGGGHMDVLSSTIMGPTITGIPSGGGGMTSFMASLQQNMANIGMGNIGLNFGGGIIHGPHGAHHSLGVGGLHHHHHHHHPEIDFNNDQLMMSQQQQPQFPNNLLGGFEVGGGGSSGGGSLYNSTFQGDHHQGVIGSGGDDGDDDEHHHHEVNDVNMNVNIPSKSCSSPAMMMSQLAPVKMEEGGQGLSLAKQLMMGISSSSSDNANGGGGGGGNQFWSFPIPNANTIGATTGMWTDLSGLNSSSMN